MYRQLLLATSLWLTLATAHAEQTLERALESTTDAISLPERLPGSIGARGCLRCPSIRMQVPETARFFIGDDQVTLKELRSYSLGKQYNMVVFYENDAFVVRRIKVEGQLPRRPAR